MIQMRTIITKTNIYTIDELKKLDENAYENALKNLRERWHSDIMEFDWSEVKESLTKFLELFSLRIYDYQVGLYSPSYITDNSEEYRERSNYEINEDVKTLNKWLKSELYDDLTGVWSDYTVFSYFTKNNIKEVSYNDIHKHLQEISSNTLVEFIDMGETNLESEEYLLDYAYNTDAEFTEYGDFHY